jgi:hypothetical protein
MSALPYFHGSNTPSKPFDEFKLSLLQRRAALPQRPFQENQDRVPVRPAFRTHRAPRAPPAGDLGSSAPARPPLLTVGDMAGHPKRGPACLHAYFKCLGLRELLGSGVYLTRQLHRLRADNQISKNPVRATTACSPILSPTGQSDGGALNTPTCCIHYTNCPKNRMSPA